MRAHTTTAHDDISAGTAHDGGERVTDLQTVMSAFSLFDPMAVSGAAGPDQAMTQPPSFSAGCRFAHPSR